MLGMVLGTQAVQSPRCVGCLVGLCRGFPPSSLNFPFIKERNGFLPPEGLQVRAACCRRGSGRSAAAARSRLRGDLVLPGVGAATAAVRKGFATLVFVFEAAIDL